MTLRKVPGALALGLLASLAAHAALYGGEHSMGGAYHALLVQTALVGALGFLTFFAALAWGQSEGIADGTVLAARLRERLPATTSVLAAAAFWYSAAEAVEPRHSAVPTVAALCALAFAAYATAWLARKLAAVLARAVLAVVRTAFLPRARSWRPRGQSRPVFRRILVTRRRFARPPPPIAMFSRA